MRINSRFSKVLPAAACALMLAACGKTVLISDYFEYYRLGAYLARYTKNKIGVTMGAGSLCELFNEKYYAQLDGGILESFGRLFKNDLKLYIYPLQDRKTGAMTTVDNLQVAPELRNLYRHLVEKGCIEQLDNYRIRCVVNEPGKPQRTLVQEQLFRLQGLAINEIPVGENVIRLAREAIGLWLAQEKFSALFFGQGARPSVWMQVPGKLSDAAYSRLKEQSAARYAGLANMHRIGLAEQGSTIKEVGFSAKDSQLTESRDGQVQEIARWLNIPEHMLRTGKQPTFASVEQFGQEFIDITLRPWAVRWEQSADRDLVFEDDIVLRHDAAARIAAIPAGLPPGWEIVMLGYNTDTLLELKMGGGSDLRGTFSVHNPSEAQLAEFARGVAPVGVFPLNHAFGMGAYLISPAGARALADLCFPMNDRLFYIAGMEAWFQPFGIDGMLNAVFRDRAAYACFPPLAWSRNDVASSTVQTA